MYVRLFFIVFRYVVIKNRDMAVAAFSGAVAAVGAAGHLVYLVAASPVSGDAARNNRGLVRAELVRILSPCNRRAKGDVDHYTLRVVVLRRR